MYGTEIKSKTTITWSGIFNYAWWKYQYSKTY